MLQPFSHERHQRGRGQVYFDNLSAPVKVVTLVRFEAYLQILPAFLSIKPELATTSNLQKIVDKVPQNPYPHLTIL